MSTSLNAENILTKINNETNCYSVNNDSQLTRDARDIIALTPWDSVARNNRRYLRMQLGFTDNADISEDFSEMYITSIKRINEAKNITATIPPKTRFRFFKRLINRLNRTTIIHQQVFNNEMASILGSFYKEIIRLHAENAEMKQHIEDLSALNAKKEENK